MTASRVPQRIAILGLGVMGASIGMALHRAGVAEVVGWDPDADAVEAARELGAVGQSVTSPECAVSSAELITLAAPVPVIPELASHIVPHMRDDAVVTDIGSVKTPIVQQCERLLGERFVGGHPMAGTEMHGARHANPAMLRDAPWILTPTARTSEESLMLVRDLIASLGARPVTMEPDEHDRLVAYISHLPHAVAFALAAAVHTSVEPDGLALAGGSFRSGTRVAASDPSVWSHIMVQNAGHVTAALDRLLPILASIRDAAARGDVAALSCLLASRDCPPRP
ncbi:MAG: prephenate dehydrogenase/arogenate dehydrogenase family protein [Chthonomonadales bacterium]|nr:prephenate dehydrogenase/arogenate dehydrogenase family protein [Chthonomonadales bacterium]